MHRRPYGTGSKCLVSLVAMYAPVLRGMRPLTAQINAMTNKATEYRTAHAQPSALFEIELWYAAIIVALRQPHTLLAVPLQMFIRNLRDREPYPTVSDASPLRLCAALYSAVTGEVLAWVTYRLP